MPRPHAFPLGHLYGRASHRRPVHEGPLADRGHRGHSLFRGRPAEDNPWAAASLEWTVAPPPPHGNFNALIGGYVVLLVGSRAWLVPNAVLLMAGPAVMVTAIGWRIFSAARTARRFSAQAASGRRDASQVLRG